MFETLDNLGYEKYLKENPFYSHLEKNKEDSFWQSLAESPQPGSDRSILRQKTKKGIWDSVNPNNEEAFPSELDDLIRLHFLVTSRKVTTILEFGVGKSTKVFDDALSRNKSSYKDFVSKNLRRSNAFECHSIDNSSKWIERVKSEFSFENVIIHYSKCRMSDFNGRICTFYDQLPNITPDFIYLDAPDQFSIEGEVRGISTRSQDRVPMAADILAIEHFLLPGTLIVVDGRAANARFLKTNLQRDWSYKYEESYDQHFFELVEEHLGPFNAAQLQFSRSAAAK